MDIRTYNYLISIGMNCEIRYQLKQKFGAIDIHPDFCKYKEEKLRTFVQRVSDTIQKIAKKASLLIITLEENLNTLKDLDNGENLFIRTLNHFAPYNQATNPEYVDLQRGSELLSEFKPKDVKQDTKVYKFEKKQDNR